MSELLIQPSEKSMYRTSKVLLTIVAVMIGLRLFLYQHFLIPSGSMIPTLLIGDMIIVDKSAYGYSKYGMPFHLNVIQGRKWATMPKRGDIIVFNNPQNDKIDFVKRCIGLPGDRIKFDKGILSINGAKCTYQPIEDYRFFDDEDKQVKMIHQYEETLDNDVKHKILMVKDTDQERQTDPMHNTYEIVVPENHFLPIGDNRNRSWDGRCFGPVHTDRLIGKGRYILMSFTFEFSGDAKNPLTWWKLRLFPRFSRFGITPV